jgi:hypothetical protein
MLKAITSEAKVKKLNTRLFKRLREYDYVKLPKRIIFPQGHWDCNIFYSEELGLWWYSDFAGQKYAQRYWNVFGLENPHEKNNLNIACEINMPLKGVNFRTAGLWAADANNRIYLLHSGKIGGGTKGVGKGLFLENYTGGKLVDVYVDGLIKKYAPVTELEAPNLGEQMFWFVKEIDRIKTIARLLNKPTVQAKQYRPEFYGSKKYNLPEEVSADCNHGIVVEALKEAIEALGIQAYNSQQIDLYTSTRKRVQNVFEVKTSLSRQTVYTATGQLLINSITVKPRPKMFFVCPNNIKDGLVDDLNELGISVITYSWQNKEPRFTNLNDFF